jgi:hypothetical protein
MSTESQTRKFAAMGADGPHGRMGATTHALPGDSAGWSVRSDCPANDGWCQWALDSLLSAPLARHRRYRPGFGPVTEGRSLMARMGNRTRRPPERRTSAPFARIRRTTNSYQMTYWMSSPIPLPCVAAR